MAQHLNSDTPQDAGGLTQTEALAIALGVAWMVVIGLFFFTAPPAQTAGGADANLRRILIVIAVFMPVGLIWVAAAAARHARLMRAESYRVQTAIEGLRQMQVAQQAQQPQVAAAPSVEKQLVEIAQSTKNTENAVSGFATRREVSRLITPRAAPQIPGDQPALELGTTSEDMNPPLERRDLIQALNFPDDEHDTEGFAALRRALRDRSARRLVQASQDVLTLMSQDGIYMDDLRPSPVAPELWRRFAAGERGQDINGLGAIRDRSSLALTAGRMREDTIFRDAVHHFLRRFDETLITFEEHATDTDLLQLSETRTSRAFMVLARSSGTFD